MCSIFPFLGEIECKSRSNKKKINKVTELFSRADLHRATCIFKTFCRRYLLRKLLKKNAHKNISKVISTHRKKLKNLTKNTVLPFSPNEIVNNLSSLNLTDDELERLKNWLGFSIKPPHLNKTDILASFEKIHYTMKDKLMDEKSATHLKTEIAHLAQNYISSYHPSRNDLKKHRILRTLKNNSNIIILKPDKGNGVVILDRNIYFGSCFDILSDKSKFKLLDKYPTLLR